MTGSQMLLQVDVSNWPAERVAQLKIIADRLASGRGVDNSTTTPVASTTDDGMDDTERPTITRETYELLLALIERKGGKAEAQVIRLAMETGEPVTRATALDLLDRGPTDKLPKFRSKVMAAVKELQGAGVLDESIHPRYGVLTVDYGKGVTAQSFFLGEALVALRNRGAK